MCADKKFTPCARDGWGAVKKLNLEWKDSRITSLSKITTALILKMWLSRISILMQWWILL